MNSIVKTVPPELCSFVLNGVLDVLFSKTIPTEVDLPFTGYLYLPKLKLTSGLHKYDTTVITPSGAVDGTQKIVAEFTCSKFTKFILAEPRDIEYCIRYYDLLGLLAVRKYLTTCLQRKYVYVWQISNVRILDKFMSLSDIDNQHCQKLADWRYIRKI